MYSVITTVDDILITNRNLILIIYSSKLTSGSSFWNLKHTDFDHNTRVGPPPNTGAMILNAFCRNILIRIDNSILSQYFAYLDYIIASSLISKKSVIICNFPLKRGIFASIWEGKGFSNIEYNLHWYFCHLLIMIHVHNLPSKKHDPINFMTFGCGSLLAFLKIVNSAKRSDWSDPVALSEKTYSKYQVL